MEVQGIVVTMLGSKLLLFLKLSVGLRLQYVCVKGNGVQVMHILRRNLSFAAGVPLRFGWCLNQSLLGFIGLHVGPTRGVQYALVP